MKMFQLYFYVPETHVEQVKKAVFDAGAGRQGLYQECCFTTSGQGQFKPNEGSNAYLGEVGRLTSVNEIKVETLCEESIKGQVKQALIAAHPYEEVAYGFVEVSQ